MSNIWRLLNIDGLTIDASFGLEYYLFGDIDKAKPLLKKGIQFCDMVQKGYIAITKDIINSSDLEAWEDIQTLVKYNSPEELKSIVEKANMVKTDLVNMIQEKQENTIYSEDKIRDIQQFFIDVGRPYLSRAYNLMKRTERCLKVDC